MAACLLGAPVVAAVEGEAPAAPCAAAGAGPCAVSSAPTSRAATPLDPARDHLGVAREAARLGRTREAMRALAAAVREQPAGEDAGEALLGLAEHHRAAGDLTRARAALEAARRAEPARARAEARLAELASALRDEVARLETAAAAARPPRYAGAGAPALPRLRSRSSL